MTWRLFFNFRNISLIYRSREEFYCSFLTVSLLIHPSKYQTFCLKELPSKLNPTKICQPYVVSKPSHFKRSSFHNLMRRKIYIPIRSERKEKAKKKRGRGGISEAYLALPKISPCRYYKSPFDPVNNYYGSFFAFNLLRFLGQCIIVPATLNQNQFNLPLG